MSSQFTAQSLSDYLSAVSSKNLEDQELTDSSNFLSEERKQQGVELLGTSSLPLMQFTKNAYSGVSKLATQALDFKDKAQTLVKQVQALPETGEAIAKDIGNKLGNKLTDIGGDAVSKLKGVASEKMSGLVDEAQSQGAKLMETGEGESRGMFSSLFEQSKLSNLYKRFKQATTTGEEQATQLQQKAFDQDPEAGLEQLQNQAPIEAEKPVPSAPSDVEKPEGAQPEDIPESKPVEATPEADVGEATAQTGEDIVKGAGEAVGSAVGEAVGEAAGEAVASAIPGIGEVVDAGLLLFQTITGMKDLFESDSPTYHNDPEPTFQAGI
jgi:hypothetical protein